MLLRAWLQRKDHTVLPGLRDLRISHKFSCAFGGVCLVAALLGVVALAGFLKVDAAINVLVRNSMPSIKVLG